MREKKFFDERIILFIFFIYYDREKLGILKRKKAFWREKNVFRKEENSFF